MKIVLVGAAVLAFAGGASLKDLNVSQPERDVLSGRVIYSTICIRCHGVEGEGRWADEVHSSGRRPHVSGGSRKVRCEVI